jgi:hypothetical protein
MFNARWQIDAKFGHKQAVIDMLRQWERDIGRQAGTGEMDFRIMTGSIGAREATVEAHHSVESLAQLERFFAALGNIPAHGQWSKELEAHVVSGTAFWQVFRMV